MAYSTNAELANASDESQIVQLVDDQLTGLATIEAVQATADDPQDPNQLAAQDMLARIDAARADADELINTFLRGRHEIPLEPVPSFIADISTDLTKFNLYKRRMGIDLPDSAKELKSEALKTIKAVQRGDLKISDQPQVQAGQFKTNKTADDRVFGDDRLDRF